MDNFKIEVLPTHSVVTVRRDVSIPTIRAIMDELAKLPDFNDRNGVWILDQDVATPPFTDFPMIVDLVRSYYHGDVSHKRAALVVGGGLNRALADMFCSEAGAIPFEIQAFTSLDEAMDWLETGIRRD